MDLDIEPPSLKLLFISFNLSSILSLADPVSDPDEVGEFSESIPPDFNGSIIGAERACIGELEGDPKDCISPPSTSNDSELGFSNKVSKLSPLFIFSRACLPILSTAFFLTTYSPAVNIAGTSLFVLPPLAKLVTIPPV